MSTLGQPNLEPAWKQEITRRLAAHKNRKGATNEPNRPEPAAAMNSRAAEAAARVAARYAKAPSYTQMQAEEARVAVRAAQIATKVAMEAQAVAESALAELHAAADAPIRPPAVVHSIQRPPVVLSASLPFVDEAAELAPPTVDPGTLRIDPAPQPPPAAALPREPLAAMPASSVPAAEIPLPDRDTLSIRWEPDMPTRAIEMPAAPPSLNPREQFELATEDWWTPAQVHETLRSEPLVVNALPGHANLIEFPRELVATRKMRPRAGDAQSAPAVEGQLSIFEVDPGAVSITPEIASAAPLDSPAYPSVAYGGPAYPSLDYAGPEWSGIELEAHPIHEQRAESAADAKKLDLAPLGRRLLAYVVDGALILAAFFAVALYGVAHSSHIPAPRTMEIMAAVGIALATLAYQAAFFSCGLATPGMRYAGIAFSTFDDELATPAQTRRRLGAMLLSLAPFGLGMVWAVFDEDHLSWHDRISATYLRKRI